MSDYYIEISDYDRDNFGYPSNIVHFKEWRAFLMEYAWRAWEEKSDGRVQWVKQTKPIPTKLPAYIKLNVDLTEEELNEFVWIKLRAHNV